MDGGDLLVKGADLLDGTPIFDIKPYLPYVDAHPDARGGFTEQTAGYGLTVECAPELLAKVPKEKQAALLGVLQNDPRRGISTTPSGCIRWTLAPIRCGSPWPEKTLQVQEIL